ncbi:MAG TPA: hypothetical protein VNS60_10320 [Solirubrobacterales bacterium]|nr:hypothetical protein [Solirubrobacterales bacterium]
MSSFAVETREPIFRTRSSRVASLQASRVATNAKSGRKRRVPMFIPADQAFYWSSKWQRDEAKSLADLKAGRSRRFADAQGAIRHLLSDD